MKNLSGLRHLNHEGGAPARKIIRCSDARPDAINERQACTLRRNERPGLSEYCDDCRLPKYSAFASHVRACDDEQAVRRAVHIKIVRDEWLLTDSFNYRMTALRYLYLISVVHDGSNVAVARSGFSERS